MMRMRHISTTKLAFVIVIIKYKYDIEGGWMEDALRGP